MKRAIRRTSPDPTPAEVAEFEAAVNMQGAAGQPASPPPDAEPETPAGQPPRHAPAFRPLRHHSGIDHSTRRKLKRGRIPPTRTLDLHGYRVAEARTVVRKFVLDAQAGGHRCVRVVTGRKLGESGPTGALRQALPEIVGAPPLDGVVLGFEPAPARHGGDGAFYLLIRARTGR